MYYMCVPYNVNYWIKFVRLLLTLRPIVYNYIIKIIIMNNLYRYRFRNVSEDHHKNDAKLSKFNYRNVCKSIQAHQHALRSVSPLKDL